MRGGGIMLRTTRPNISIITNFGCHANCWYCIWKTHPLKDVKLETDWEKLRAFLVKYQDRGKVSVSGGGDCLYHYDQHVGWWIRLFEETKDLNMLVDVHTREKFTHQRFWKKINRCVFSSDRLEDDREYLEYLANLVKIRITHLVTKDTTYKMIEDYLRFQQKINCQFTIKELVGYDDGGRYKEIRKKYPEIFHLDEGDYNIYYMPDNVVRDKFLF
jgi:hypothetical protein